MWCDSVMWVTSGWPLGESDQRSAGHCPYEAVLPWVTRCPLSPRYLSLPDSPFFFLSWPLLLHLPIFSSPLLGLAPFLESFSQYWLRGPRRAETTLSHHPRPGYVTSSFRGLPNNGGQSTGLWKYTVCELLRPAGRAHLSSPLEG